MRGLSIPAFVLLLLGCLQIALAQIDHREKSHKMPSLTNPGYGKMVVAKVGNRAITAEEFLLSYEFGPAFPKSEPDSKKRYLDFMINEKLLALDGYAHGLERSPQARQALAEMEGDLASEELYKDDIAAKVHIPSGTIERGVADEQISLDVKWLYAASIDEAGNFQRKMKSGISFDSLFALQLASEVSREDRSMEMSKFRLQMRNPVLASILDTLPVGKISLPIHVEDGWYIVKLGNIWKSPIVAETEVAKRREDVNRALVQHVSDSLSDLYVNRIITHRQPIIVRRNFDIMEAHLAQSIVDSEAFARWNILDELVQKWGPVDVSDISPFREDSLVAYAGGYYTVDDFLRWYDARSPNLKLRLESPQTFFASLQGYVWRMVRDRFLAERALQRGYQKKKVVKAQLQWWKDKIVYELRKAALADSITLDDSALHKYYNQHPRDYRDTTLTLLPFDQVKDNVKKDHYNAELTKLMLHCILALKQKYHVTVYEKELQSLHVDSENDPRAIEVYAVKKGGTFPHPAFPSIDHEWSTWE